MRTLFRYDSLARFTLSIAICALNACSALHIKDDDSALAITGKSAARVPLAIVSLGISELWHMQERRMESWIGHHESELYLAWGTPTEVVSDGAGGKIAIYRSVETVTTPGYSTTTARAYGSYYNAWATANTVTTPPTTTTVVKMRNSRIDSQGRIIAYAWNGL